MIRCRPIGFTLILGGPDLPLSGTFPVSDGLSPGSGNMSASM